MTGGPGTPPYVFWYLHTDHLNTPRMVENPTTGEIVWRWDSAPFGETAAAEDPDGDTLPFTMPLRFPGQYLDSETGLHYNYFRDYEPQTGRYVESDPLLGVFAGIDGAPRLWILAYLNQPKWLTPYTYVIGNPNQEADPYGLGPFQILKCLYYGRQVVEAGKQCRKDCPTDTIGQIRFIETYATNGSLDTAMLNCTCQKAGPDLCPKWLANCFAGPVMQGPKP